MAENSAISWTDHTFNPWVGCQKVSAGCLNCYAETLMDRRWGKVKWGPGGTRVVTSEANWRQPLKWNRQAEETGGRLRVFCASLADVFEDRPELMEPRRRLFDLIQETPNLDWLLLTKRPQNIQRMIWETMDSEQTTKWERQLLGKMLLDPWRIEGELWRMASHELFGRHRAIYEAILAVRNSGAVVDVVTVGDELDRSGILDDSGGHGYLLELLMGAPVAHDEWLHNVWLGTSVENQEQADKRIPELLKVPAVVRFISAEPLLGPVSFRWAKWAPLVNSGHLDGLDGIHWVIAGGESGPHARPMRPDWARSLRDQCQAASVPFHFKQWGEWAPLNEKELCMNIYPTTIIDSAFISRVGKKRAGRLLDGREWNDSPDPIRIGKVPAGSA